MITLLYIIIGFIADKTLRSCGANMWQYGAIMACIIASMAIAYFLM